MANVAIIDYGLGNVHSVLGAVQRLGHTACVSGDVDQLREADALILPGVGAFGDGMRNLRERGLVEPLSDIVTRQQKPILGICLGAQLMTNRSCEFGHHDGLRWVDASVERLDVKNLPLPHVGWNDVRIVQQSRLFQDLSDQPLFYFVHTFHIRCRDESLVTGQCQYGNGFTACYEKENIYGSQFHPEKSQAEGLLFLSNFLDLVSCN